ncbi:TolC family protein [Tumebacillus sp. ITR2]|uniref:TolC family protein n=1 Tax=Tumebacillus amylolyticus TaxID=2801339 RepID=A0ABS1JCV5_9BACL|nr:TolC family protein [Tumebacillus amylolyticus]MBL0388107.1 TolC family protein [Tumebacillus amylolyticus]
MLKKRRPSTVFHLVMLGVLTFQQLGSASSAYASEEISLSDAIRNSVDASAEITTMKNVQLTQADFDLAQAYQTLRNQDEKDNSNKAKEHSMSRDIDLGLKVPQAMLNKKKLQHQLDDKVRQTQVQTEQAYMTAYQQQVGVDNATAALQKAEQKAKDLRAKQKFGYATADDVTAADALVVQTQTNLQTAQLSFKSGRLALGQLLGKDLDGDYRFELPRVYANLTQDTMWKLYESAKSSDFDLFQDTEATNMAQTKANIIRGLYQNKFGTQATSLLASMYQSPKAPDYNSFLSQYDSMILSLKNKWKGKALVLALSFPFIKIVDKVELQGEYQDDRYFEDLSSSLPMALLDLDKAKLKEADTRNKLAAKIKSTYLTAKQAEAGYLLALKAEATAKETVESAKGKIKFGQLTQDDVDKLQGAYEQAQMATLSSYIAYKSSLSTLNLAAGGTLPYASGIPKTAAETGTEAFKPQPPAPKSLGLWQLEPVAKGMTSSFKLKLADGATATHFALRLKQGGQLIGDKTPINGGITHLDLVFQDPSLLQVVLYAGDKQIAVTDLSGYAPSGQLTESPDS